MTKMDNRMKRTNREMKPLRCLQVNLQHKCAATSNLAQMMCENQIDLAFVQQPYIIHNNLAGIPKSLRTYVSGNGRKRRSVLLVNNKEIDLILITQISDEDCIVAEISYGNTKFYGISSYFDIIQGAAERTPQFGRGIASGGECVVEQRCMSRFQFTPWRGRENIEPLLLRRNGRSPVATQRAFRICFALGRQETCPDKKTSDKQILH